MNDRSEPVAINSSTISVAGVGGIGMLALVVIIAATFPIARWLLAGGAIGGVSLAAILIWRRRNRQLGEPRSDLPIVLFSTAVAQRDELAQVDNSRDDMEESRENTSPSFDRRRVGILSTSRLTAAEPVGG